jgi:integrase
VSPICDIKQINDMKEYLLEHNERDYLMFVLGINSGLRISDILRLTVETVATGRVTIREKKTQKAKQFVLSDTCKEAINHWLKASGITRGTLFPSRKDSNEPITEKQAWRIIKNAADWCGIKENIGTHSLRKTFSYFAIKKGVSIITLMELLNHSSPAITMKYAGITQDDIDEVCINMNL